MLSWEYHFNGTCGGKWEFRYGVKMDAGYCVKTHWWRVFAATEKVQDLPKRHRWVISFCMICNKITNGENVIFITLSILHNYHEQYYIASHVHTVQLISKAILYLHIHRVDPRKTCTWPLL